MKLNPWWLVAGLIIPTLIGCSVGRQTNTNLPTNTPAASSAAVDAVTGEGKFIGEVNMAKDDGSGAPEESATTVFGEADRTIHCVTKLKEEKSGTRVRFSWWVIQAEGANNEKIRDVDYTTRARESIVHSHLTLPNDWPTGKYKVDVYVNGDLDRSIPFSVE